MVQTLIQATGSNRSSEARDGKARGRAFITLLFAVIALFLLLALLVGTSASPSGPSATPTASVPSVARMEFAINDSPSRVLSEEERTSFAAR